MIEKVYIPPIKIQGIKTKLVETISDNVYMNENSVWYEPFMGSGVVGINLAPRRAVFSDTNPYTIALYNAIKSGDITSRRVREYLEYEGAQLAEKDDKHYYYIRDRFNESVYTNSIFLVLFLIYDPYEPGVNLITDWSESTYVVLMSIAIFSFEFLLLIIIKSGYIVCDFGVVNINPCLLAILSNTGYVYISNIRPIILESVPNVCIMFWESKIPKGSNLTSFISS